MKKALTAVFVVLLAAMALQAAAGEVPQLIDINKATAEELIALPRIGPAVAARIIAYREENGPFRKLEDLLNVRGIGQKTFELLKDRIAVSAPQAEARGGDAQ